MVKVIENMVIRPSSWKTWLSGEYPVDFIATTDENLEVPVGSSKGDSHCCLSSRVLAIVNPLAEFH